MRISNLLANIAKTKPAEKFFKWAGKPGSDQFLNNTLPQVETVLSTACYVWSTARQKNIEKDQKDLLQIQNIGSGLVGLAVGSYANRKVSKFGEALIKELDPKKIDPKAIRQISSGIRVALPLAMTGVIMRLGIPTILALFSGKWMDKVRENRKVPTGQIKLDKKA